MLFNEILRVPQFVSNQFCAVLNLIHVLEEIVNTLYNS